MRPWIENMSQRPNRININKFKSGYVVVKLQKANEKDRRQKSVESYLHSFELST